MLPELEPLLGELLERRARVVASRDQLTQFFGRGSSDIGGADASQLVLEFTAIERLTEKVQRYGCIIKDLNAGLVDFLSERNGREIYLCWRYGEPNIGFYHELHTGFSDRKPV